MKKLFPLLFLFLHFSAFCQTGITPAEAAKHIGKKMTVSGTVFDGRYFGDSENKVTLLNLGAPFPKSPFTVVIPLEVRKKMTFKPEEYLRGWTLHVTGTVTEQKGKPQIIVKSVTDMAYDVPAEEKVVQPEIISFPVEDEIVEDKVYTFAEKMPQLPGGTAKMDEFFTSNLKVTPAAKNAKATGVVVVRFVVNAKGKVTEPQILKSLGYGLDEETLRVVKQLPAFEPGEQNGRMVACNYTMMTRFVDGKFTGLK